MRVCIDTRCLAEGRRTGVEEYTLGLLKNLFILDKKNDYVLFFNSWKDPNFDFLEFSEFQNVKIKKLHIPNKFLNFLFWYLNWPKIDKLVGNADIIFFPNIIFCAVSQNVKVIQTIHDLSFERYPEYFSTKIRWWHNFINPKKLCRRANRIISVSDSTKSDVVSLYKINPEKIATIHSAVSETFKIIDRNNSELVRVKEKYNLPYRFILYLGTIEPRKNIQVLIKAFNKLKSEVNKEIIKYKLVIAGSPGWLSDEIFQEIDNSEYKNDIIVINYVDNEDKVYLYNLASLFVYPSFFEGFGFPPLEAMACGVPVICSNNSSLPEVSGGAAIMIDPDKPSEIFLAMEEIILNNDFKEVLVKKGLLQAQKFNWQNTAKHVLKIINNLC